MWNNKKNIGFSIIEVVIVTAIVSLAFIGLSALNIMSLQSHNMNRSNLTASALAQEGIEIVRNRRDQNWLTAGNPWLQGIPTNEYFALDYTGSIIKPLTGQKDQQANLKLLLSGYYASSTAVALGSPTKFYRTLKVEDGGHMATTTCTVLYNERGIDKKYEIKTILYNWR